MNPNITKIIDQYLANELSHEDRLAFEEKMASNEKLKSEVALHQSIQEGAQRLSDRTAITKVRKQYHLNKLLKWGTISLSSLAIVAATALWIKNSEIKQNEQPTQEFIALIEDKAPINDLDAQYFQIGVEGAIKLSENGVLLSIPKHAFLKDGKPYEGPLTIQFQEAMYSDEIVKSGLSTMSGDRLLETQGMFGLTAYSPDGKQLELNPKVGVYVQVPVDEYKDGMQLFDGVKDKNGNIDWQNPKPLAKIPVSGNMSDLDFYPEKYEPYLDFIKWKKDKKSRDSLYLSFEDWGRKEIYEYASNTNLGISEAHWIPQRKLTVAENKFLYPNNPPIDNNINMDEAMRLSAWKENPNYFEFEYLNDDLISDSTHQYDSAIETDAASPFIRPSKVLGFWKKKFNNTNLATRDFEKRMRAVHNTCSEAVLRKYTNQLKKGISEIDKEVVEMGFSEFEQFALENVGKVELNNAHAEQLQAFYENSIEALKIEAKQASDKERKRRQKHDKEISDARYKETKRTTNRNAIALNEEFNFNMESVKKQIGPSVGFTLTHGKGTIVNIDKYVMDATISRTSATISDPFTGKTAEIVYNDFNFEVVNSDKYIKLFAYVFPDKLNSYQRIDHKNGKFNYPLNDGLIYDFCVVGVTENGYEYFQKQTINSGELGSISLKKISENEMEASIRQMNGKRASKPMNIKEEIKWLIKEKEDYVEQKRREEMKVFRENISRSISICLCLK